MTDDLDIMHAVPSPQVLTEDPIPPTPTERAELAAERIGQILRQYRCHLAPVLNVENVGRDPIGKVIVTAGFVVQPL